MEKVPVYTPDYARRNLTMMTDLYQLTMMYGYFKNGMGQSDAVFDLFFREVEGKLDYAVMAGTESVVQYIDNLHFTDDDIAYLDTLGLFDKPFLDYLRDFRFTGEIYAMPEGSIVFPREPLVRVRAPLMQAQLIETALLNLVNHQTLIATKASRVQHVAGSDIVMEFGARRAQGPDAATLGARAAMIGGCVGTSNVLTGKLYGVPVMGTHAHSWVMSFPDELSAFRAYANIYPDACMLLVDTYDTLKSGVPNAIKVFDELKAQGHKPVGIRLDSGDLAYLSKTARKMLDDAGHTEAKICASGDLDEYVIRELKAQGARIDTWGVGTKMITSAECPALGGVYKLAAEEINGELIPRIKVSENPVKVTNPGYKKVLRLYRKSDGKAIADLIALVDEDIREGEPLRIFDPVHRYKSQVVENFSVREMLKPLFVNGKLVCDMPTLAEIREYAEKERKTFWGEYLRIVNPHAYKVDLSDGLYEMKSKMLADSRGPADGSVRTASDAGAK